MRAPSGWWLIRDPNRWLIRSSTACIHWLSAVLAWCSRIFLCAAATPVTVPNVIGQTQDQATATLTDAGLTAAPTTTSNCNSADNGSVVTQNPAGGASVDKGSSVTINVCSPTPVE